LIIYGKNPVKEALFKSSLKVEEVFVSEESKREKVSEIMQLAKARGIKVSFLPHQALSRISQSASHQGIAAAIADFKYDQVQDIINIAKKKGEKTLIIILDHIEDPQNLGAIIRTANALGAHGIVIPKDRAASVSPAVVKASAGASSFVSIARVVNLVAAMKELKKKGVWILGGDQSATRSIFEEDLKKLDLAVAIGSEGKGLGKLVKEECDFLVSIPNVGEVSSLNASVAGGILLYEIVRQRRCVQGI
jgi:23S rRNA (guanosine2251-2'-O)-methyltransferase